MKLNFMLLSMSVVAVLTFSFQSEASAQTPQKEPDVYERAETEADRLSFL